MNVEVCLSASRLYNTEIIKLRLLQSPIPANSAARLSMQDDEGAYFTFSQPDRSSAEVALFALRRLAVLSRRYKRKAIKRSFPSTTSSPGAYLVRLSWRSSRITVRPSWTLLSYSETGAGVVRAPKVSQY